MSGDSGWWARHLGNPQQQPQQPAYPQPPAQYQPPQQYQQVPPQYQQYPPQQQQPQYQQAPPQQQQFDPNQIRVTPENLFEVTKFWQGGQGTKLETQNCPQCGGGHYFSRASHGASRGPAPAPLCYDCGYNGQFIQGDPSNWQGA